MADILDSEAGSERFASYEAELKLVQADLQQKLDQIPELSGEPRKAAIRQAERAQEEAKELRRVCTKPVGVSSMTSWVEWTTGMCVTSALGSVRTGSIASAT